MITLRIMCGLGNQMFQYAFLRSMMEEYQEDGVISLKGITNKQHEIYALNHFNINKNIKVINKDNFKSKFTYLIYGLTTVFLVGKKNSYKIVTKMESLLNKLGMICVIDGYLNLDKCNKKNKYIVGFYESPKYFNKYQDIIKKELRITTKPLAKNKNILKEIKAKNAVCVHVRRKDYVGTNHDVCNASYYLKAIEIMKTKVKKPTFYIFSDDIKWVKKNIKFNCDVTYIDNNNPSYEELRLMYSCKHFIIANSSFSWWAQYLTNNKKRITIAPSKWFKNKYQPCDLYQEDWILVDV